MSSPGSRATQNPVRAIKHALIGRCASTCKGRQAGVGDLGLDIIQATSTHGETARIRRRLQGPRRRNRTVSCKIVHWRARRDSNFSTKTFRYQEVFVAIWSEGQVEGQGGVVP